MPTGVRPAAAVATKDSTKLYVANAGDGSVEAIDLQNRVVLASTRVGGAPGALALTPDERFLAVTDSANSSLAILGTSPMNPKMKIKGSPPPLITTLPLITTIPVGARPADVVIPDWLEAP
jgi:YVTN family beta-propeller protein